MTVEKKMSKSTVTEKSKTIFQNIIFKPG